MDVGILGPLVARRDGSEVTIGPAKHRALLALLVLRHGELVPIETLVDALWEGHPPATATKIVQGYVSQLRKAVGDGVLETRPGGYVLRIDPTHIDAARFEVSLGHASTLLADGDPAAAAVVLRSALALWRGPALVEFRFQDFAANEIRRLDELRLVALEYRLEADVADGRHAAVVPEIQELVRAHPLRENLRHLLMIALYRAGRQADALAAYQDARQALVEQLGLDPSESLQRLEAAILVHDPDLDPPRPTQDRAALPPTPEASAPEASAPEPRASPAAKVATGAQPLPVAAPSAAGRRRRVRRRRVVLVTVGAAALVVAGGVAALRPQDGARSLPAAAPVDSVAFIDGHRDRVTNRITVTGEPSSVTVGESGVWMVNTVTNTVARLDPRSDEVVQTIPVGLDPSGLAVCGTSVWVANHDDNTVSRISPQTNAVVQVSAVGAGPVAVACGYGSVWVTNGDDRTLARIDAATGALAATIRTNAVGRGVAVGGGLVWVTDEASNRLVGIDPTTDTVVSTATVGTGPTSLAYRAGSVWVVNALDGTVSQVDAHTFAVRSTIPVPGGPSAISVAPDAVWVSAEFASSVFRINPTRGVIVGTVALANRPEGLAATSDGVWVALQASGVGHRGGRLVVIGDDLDSIDPAEGAVLTGTTGPAYDALTSLRRVGGSAGSQIVPDLAAALPQPTGNRTSYTFLIRPRIRYSDGRILQPADFRRALERILLRPGGFPVSYSHILGASECKRSHCDLSRGVLTNGTSSITFRLTRPDPSLFEELSFLVPVPSDTPAGDTGTTPVPGTGPYTIQSYVPGRLLTFERNRYFHVWSQAARPDGYPDELVYRIVKNQNDAVRQLIAGRGDLVEGLGTESPSLAQFAAQHPTQVHVSDQQALVFVFLNVQRPPFNDLGVRRALNYAVDRRKVADLYGFRLARPACQLLPPTITGYRAYCPYTVDPDPQGRWTAPDLARARKLVTASGTKGQTVVLWSGPAFLTEARYLVDLLDKLGYRAHLHEIADGATYFNALNKTPEAQAGTFGWYGTPLAADMFSALTCRFDPNPAHFCVAGIDAQITRLADEEPADPAATLHLAASIDRELTDLAPWVPLFSPRSIDVTSARVGNYHSQIGQVLLDQLWLR